MVFGVLADTKFTSIYDFEYTDFELDGYQSGEKINFDVAI